jgi:hypothetical protein
MTDFKPKFKTSVEAYEMQNDCMMNAEEFWSEMDLEVDPFFYSAVWQFVVGEEGYRLQMPAVTLKAIGYEFEEGGERNAMVSFKKHLENNEIPFIHDTFENLKKNPDVDPKELKEVEKQWIKIVTIFNCFHSSLFRKL